MLLVRISFTGCGASSVAQSLRLPATAILLTCFHHAKEAANPISLLPKCIAELLETGEQIFRGLGTIRRGVL